ncbi:MAG: hypothetical protein P8Z78_03120 [Gammaproteobacteria bacterium]
MTRHLVVDISGHGLGHLSQVAPVVERLAQPESRIRFTLRSALPERLLRSRIAASFDYREVDLDRGMLMHDAISVDVDASCAWYEAFHADYAQRLERETRQLEALRPDLLLADVPYIGLAAAQRLGIPSVALCSLNWADIYRHYCGGRRGSEAIADEILAAYAGASAFLQPEPSMAMRDLDNRRQIAPIARVGVPDRERLCSLCATREAEHLILLGFGGIGMHFTPDLLPTLEKTCWIVPDAMKTSRSDVVAQSRCDMEYIDLLGSVDLVLTKTGYGTQVEAVVNRVPQLCIERPGWPEEADLFDWCREHGVFDSIAFDRLTPERLRRRIGMLLVQRQQNPAVEPAGDAQAAAIILEMLQRA